MIFLTKFKASGFKSFATNVEFNFDNHMAGVVGPNGSGKSNIVDAIKWVLGERSNKTLRGKTNEDVIFHGSTGHDASKHAEVSLTFNNKSKSLHYDADKIEITRRLTRGTGSNEYFINGEPCRLKDIQEIFLDTGLSKGSLGIISQGTVQWFVEAKPEERRTIFEEAAGIGLYTKKRDESNAQLARTTDNLGKVTLVVNELENDVKKLTKQAEKAKLYNEKRKELMHLELTILVKDIKYYKNQLDKIIVELKDSKNELEVFEPDVKQVQQTLAFSKEKADVADKNIDVLSAQLSDLMEQINKAELRKASISSELKNQISSDNVEKQAEAYRQLLSTTKFELDDAKDKSNKLKGEIEVYQDIVNGLTTKRNELANTSSTQAIKIAEVRMQIKAIDEELHNRSHMDIGVKTIIDNKHALSGIHGIVKDLLTVEAQYEKAILTALGKSLQDIVVEDTIDAQQAVEFLKSNRAGKATFLPLSTIKPRSVKPEIVEALKTRPGFINIANQLVTIDAKFENIFAFLLGNVIVAEDLNTAIILSKYAYQLYRVISLDGDVVGAGGAITGGFNKVNPALSVNLEAKQKELAVQFQTLDTSLTECRIELEKITAELNEVTTKQYEKKLTLSKYEESIKINESHYVEYEMHYDQLVKSHNLTDKREQWNENTLNETIAKLSAKKDKVNEELSVARQTKTVHKAKVDDQEAKLTELRFQIDKHRDIIAKHETDRVKCESVLQNARERINKDYHMTIEYAMENYNGELPMSDIQAREIIDRLRSEIDRIGAINMEAMNELEDKQKRYDELVVQQKQLEQAKEDMLKVIAELDNKARDDFAKTINAVNETLPSVFKYLFGGGSCRLEYVNPEDILTSGIDVSANPPGKNIVHLNLLSGGEKTLVALSILFSILQNKSFPLIILDEAESALDPANVERFGNIIKQNSDKTQFIVITHRPGTMERCDVLFGATMQTKGMTSIFKVSLSQAKNEFASDSDKN